MSAVARSSLRLSLFTMISRLLGLVRDHFQAVFFGTGPIAAAWEIAYLLPNMLRNLLAEGVLSQSFIPIYSKGLRESEAAAREAAGVIVAFLFCFLLLFVALAIASFPFLLPAFAGPAVGDPALLVQLSQIVFVFILTASLTAIFAGIANAHMLFSVPALSPILLNLVFIGTFLTLGRWKLPLEENARVLAYSVAGGGVLQLGFQALYVHGCGLWPNIRLRLRHPALRNLFALMAPAVVGASVFHLNQLMDIAIAGWFIAPEHGAIPGLRFAHRLIQLPTGIVGTALSTAILPALAAALRDPNANRGQNGRELMAALSFGAFLTIPAAVGLLMLGPAIIDLLFFGGSWGAESSATVWKALWLYAFGVPFYSANKILTSSFYAYMDTRTPVRIMLTVVPINLTMNVLLVGPLLHGGLALSTSLCAMLTNVLLLRALKERMGPMPFEHFGRRMARQALPLALLVGTLLVLSWQSDAWAAPLAKMLHAFFPDQPAPRLYGLVLVGIAMPVAMAAYFALAVRLRLDEVAVFTRLFRRRAV